MTPENPAKDQVKQTRESAAVDAAKSAAVSATLRHLSHDVDVFQSHAPMSEMYECIWGFCSANKLLVMGTVMIGGVCSVCYDKEFEEHSGNPGKEVETGAFDLTTNDATSGSSLPRMRR